MIRSTATVLVRRSRVGPRVSGWSLSFEIANHFLRAQNVQAFEKENIEDGREFLDALVFHSPVLESVALESTSSPTKGIWVTPTNPDDGKAILYFHGGGYAYFARSHLSFIAGIAHHTRVRTFVLEYPLIPENPYPAQLDCASQAYQWLLEEGYSPDNLTVMGDSAGGNLCIALLLMLRSTNLPMPAAAVGLCPWTDVGNSGDSMETNERFDWVEKRMAEKWARWFLNGRSDQEALISPVHADLTGLPPIYLQAGGKEILIDMIREFHEAARRQGAEIRLDVWDTMTHDFQAYVDLLEEARDAHRRIARFVHAPGRPG